MIELEMSVGAKGQVVIPSVFRKNFNIRPGDKVIFESNGERLILRRAEKGTVKTLEKMASRVESVKVDSDRDYEDRMKEGLG